MPTCCRVQQRRQQGILQVPAGGATASAGSRLRAPLDQVMRCPVRDSFMLLPRRLQHVLRPLT